MKKSELIKKVIAKVKKKVKDQIPGGRADNRPDSDFDKEQLAKGIKIEMEHTSDPELSKEIAKDHLAEVPNYYITDLGESRLEIMEDSAKNSKLANKSFISDLNSILDKHEPDVHEFAKAIAKILKSEYGSHNIENFKSELNKSL